MAHRLILLASFVMFLAALLTCASGSCMTNLYVSPEGNDAWSGRAARVNAGRTDGPFATLSAARDAIRAMKIAGGLPPGGVTVWVAGGVYELSKPFVLSEADSGRRDAPVIYRGSGDGEARIVGGVRIRVMKLLTDQAVLERLDAPARAQVLVADLEAAGITQYGELMRHDGSEPTEPEPGAMELYWRRRPMTLARWPNDRWATIAGIPVIIPKPQAIPTEPSDSPDEKVLGELNRDELESTADPTKIREGKGWKSIPGKPMPISGQFNYDGDRPERWKSLDDVWVHGFWMWDWLDSYEKIIAIDTDKKVISTKAPSYVEFQRGRRWYALNILEELDAPGEYYIDRRQGRLYFWPPAADGEVIVSTVGDALAILDGAQYITLRGLTFECAQGDGVDVRGGAHNRIAGCVIRNVGRVGACLYGGSDNGILSSNIYDCGCGGIRIKGTVTGYYRDRGEDRKALTPGGLFAENNDIHDYQRTKLVYSPGVILGGVGNRAVNNYIHDAPHMAILLLGNDNVAEYNRIERVCTETADAGAVYHNGCDVTELGMRIRWNRFSDIGGYTSPHHYNGVMAIYLDGFSASDVEVMGNVIIRTPIGVFHGGGRDVAITNNVFTNCGQAIVATNRGLGYKKYLSTNPGSLMMRQLGEVKYDQPPWSTRYPNLVRLPQEQPGAPLRTRIERNIIALNVTNGISAPKDDAIHIADNLIGVDPGFLDTGKGDYQLRADSPAWKMGFQRIPMEKIGLYPDEYRAALPPEP